VAIHGVTPMKKLDADGVTLSEMTEAEVRTSVQAWVTSRS